MKRVLAVSEYNDPNFMVKNMIGLEESGQSVLIERPTRRGFALNVDEDFAYLIEHEYALRTHTAVLSVLELNNPFDPKFMGNRFWQ